MIPVATSAAAWSRLRLRQSPHLRDLCAETVFTAAHFIQPIFVVEGLAGREPITGLDGNARMGLPDALDALARDVEQGVRHVLLFHVPAAKASRRIDWSALARSIAAIKTRIR